MPVRGFGPTQTAALPGVVSRGSAFVAPVLGTLSLVGSLTQGTAASGVTITGATDGSTIALNIGGLTVSTSGATRTVTGTPTASGSLTGTETLAGATGSPKTNALGSVAAAATALPQQGLLVAHWDPETLTGADNSQIASWPDSINAIPLANATSAQQPTLRTTTAPNGKKEVAMSGSQMLSVTTNAALNTAMSDGTFTVMWLYRSVTASTNSIIAQLNGAGSWVGVGSAPVSGGSARTVGVAPAAGNQNWVEHAGSVGSAAVQSVILSVNGTVGQGGIPSNFLALNGAVVQERVGPIGAQNGTFSLGYLGNNTLSMIGRCCGMLIWSGALTPAEAMQAHKAKIEPFGQVPVWQTYGKFFVAAGDSQTWGDTTTLPPIDNWFAKAMVSMGVPMGAYSKMAISGTNTGQWSANAATMLDGLPAMTGVPTHLTFLEFYNQRGALDAASGTTAANANLSFCLGRKNAGFSKIGLLTLIDDKDRWAGRANFIAKLVSDYAANGISDLIRIDQDTTVGVVGACPTTSPYTPNFSDGIHPTTVGHEAMRAFIQPTLAAW